MKRRSDHDRHAVQREVERPAGGGREHVHVSLAVFQQEHRNDGYQQRPQPEVEDARVDACTDDER